MAVPSSSPVESGQAAALPPGADLDALFVAAYDELRRLAAAVRRSDPRATLNPTALVHEAWLKLARSGLEVGSPLHFKRIAARAMRQVLIEAARRRAAGKRGRNAVLVTLEEGGDAGAVDATEVLRLEDALRSLERVNPRQALMIESRFFGGFDVAETAALLEVSQATVERDWRAARAWLMSELR